MKSFHFTHTRRVLIVAADEWTAKAKAEKELGVGLLTLDDTFDAPAGAAAAPGEANMVGPYPPGTTSTSFPITGQGYQFGIPVVVHQIWRDNANAEINGPPQLPALPLQKLTIVGSTDTFDIPAYARLDKLFFTGVNALGQNVYYAFLSVVKNGQSVAATTWTIDNTINVFYDTATGKIKPGMSVETPTRM